MPFDLPKLPYAYDALEPSIDARTMEIHHTKHHQTYITNVNKALEGKADLANKSIVELCKMVNTLPADIKTVVRNSGGGHYNHDLFWKIMAPKGQGGQPSAELQRAIDSDLGGLAKMKEEFNKAATTRFGSGWAWLVRGADGKLFITSTPNQDNPLMEGIAEKTGTPILGLDVWEHAYYLKYQNKRPDYITAWWDVVNWNQVNENFAQAKK